MLAGGNCSGHHEHGGHAQFGRLLVVQELAEDQVIDDLWPDAEGDAGEQGLATTLSRLRKLIGTTAVRRQAGHLSLDGSLCWVDCQALQHWVLNAPTDSPRTACDLIKRFYLGPFLHDEGDASWMLPLRERLHVGLIKTLSRGGEDALAKHEVDLATEFYELGLSIDDLVETFHAGLMRCHLHNGRPSFAVAAYRRCQRTLRNRLGIAPSEETARLCPSTGDFTSDGR